MIAFDSVLNDLPGCGCGGAERAKSWEWADSLREPRRVRGRKSSALLKHEEGFVLTGASDRPGSYRRSLSGITNSPTSQSGVVVIRGASKSEHRAAKVVPAGLDAPEP